jgi:hypothetical protein
MIPNVLPEKDEESKEKVQTRSNNKYYYAGVNRMTSQV